MKVSIEHYSYPGNPNYNFSREDRLATVKAYYMGITSDPIKRVEMYSMDTFARAYLPGDDYRMLYGVLLGAWDVPDIVPNGKKVSVKELLSGICTVVTYCKQQKGCQNCILRAFGCNHWNCQIDAFDLRDVLDNIKAKKKNHGYI